jgi:hypothetical protein
MQKLLEQRWTPRGAKLPNEQLLPEVIAKLIRMTGGNFRLLTRILTQIERVLDVNQFHTVSTEVVEAARDSFCNRPRVTTYPATRQIACKDLRQIICQATDLTRCNLFHIDKLGSGAENRGRFEESSFRCVKGINLLTPLLGLGGLVGPALNLPLAGPYCHFYCLIIAAAELPRFSEPH